MRARPALVLAYALLLLPGGASSQYFSSARGAALGAWTGWQMLPLMIILSSVVGSVVATALMIRGHDRSRPIPFGPYLAVAGWIALLWGETITRAYLRWAGSA